MVPDILDKWVALLGLLAGLSDWISIESKEMRLLVAVREERKVPGDIRTNALPRIVLIKSVPDRAVPARYGSNRTDVRSGVVH